MSHPLPIIKSIEDRFLRENPLPSFRSGDTVRVQVKIREGEKERLQAFEGVCIRRTGGGARATFTVRKISYGVGVERVFAENSPNIDSLEVLARGKVRQGRLYFLRNLRGKAARIKERAYDASKDAAEKKSAARKKRGAHRKAAAKADVKPVETKPAAAKADKRKSRKEAKAKKAKAPKAKSE